VLADAPTDAASTWQAWQRLRALADARYAAWLRPNDAWTVLSSSPELFLAHDARRVSTRPIKGTRARADSPAADARARDALTSSPKEIAELTMIVDLMRNDLGRVATAGTVRWGPREIEALPNVFHASQLVEAELRDGLDVWDALAATFPPGSVTGCPKFSATAKIAELEPEARGVYCGAIGFVADHGPACWSVAIRTAVVGGGGLRWHVGGGIVSDSDPTAEWEETVDKGRLLATALAGVARA
jgi:para-aminobenzoate synthetase component 1